MPKDQHMLNALDYIDKNITRNVSLYDISREAGYSVPHFYRLFKRLTGDTVGAYILRRRMSMAARDLIDSDVSIARNMGLNRMMFLRVPSSEYMVCLRINIAIVIARLRLKDYQ